jgi:hypothetical protein
MFELIKDFSFKALGFIVPSIVRWFYKPEKFTDRIKVRIRGDEDGVTYNCGELPSVHIWLFVSNFTPVEITFDRMYGRLFAGCAVGEFSHLKRYTLPPAQETEILLEFSLTDQQSEFIRRNQGQNKTSLSFGAYVISKIHSIEIAREIKTNNVRYLNCSLPQ